MKQTSVAIQGEEGSYHDKAARHYFGADYSPMYCQTFAEVFRGVVDGAVDFGLSAVENSLVGSIAPVYDLLRAQPEVVIVGEIYLAIHHSLIGLPGATLAEIKTVYSHPVALDQCREFSTQRLPYATAESTNDTAGSVDYIKELGDRTAAAIASADNAARLDLQLLQEGVEDNPENYTRFLVLAHAKGDLPLARSEPNKSSLLIERLSSKADDIAPGTLHDALGGFARQQISLTKVESRPLQGRPWRYVFYIDCLAGAQDERMQLALEALDELGAQWRLLGTYRAGETIS